MVMNVIICQCSSAYFIQVRSIQKKTGFKIHSSFKHKLHSVENFLKNQDASFTTTKVNGDKVKKETEENTDIYEKV